MKILIVEDDELIIKTLTALLQHQKYTVEVATDGEFARNLIQTFDYDLILLDISLPKLDGLSLCRQLRSQHCTAPILLLTGQNSSNDKATGLDAGADDYVVKPFDVKELVARIRALLRRGSSTVSPVLEWGGLRLDPSKLEVQYEMRPIQLTPKEYALLELFMRRPSQIFSCNTIIEHVWSSENVPTEEAVRTQIKGLRQKFKSVDAPSDFIETVYGMGYRLKALPAKPSNRISSTMKNEQGQQTPSVLAGVWGQCQDRDRSQISALEQAATACLENTLTEEQCTQAQQAARTLADSLSYNGLNKGSQLARTIEHYLQVESPHSVKEAKHLHALVTALRKEIESSPQELGFTFATHNESRPKLLIVDSDRKLAGELAHQAETQGMAVEIATNLSEARDKVYSVHPNVVLLDPVIGKQFQDSLALLAELLLQKPPIPVLVFTEDSNFNTRLDVVRLGGRSFLQKPLPVDEVIQAVMEVLQPTNMGTEATIIVADSNPQLTGTLCYLLEPLGLKIILLEDPQKLWETIEASLPDLLIINFETSNLNGFELCQVVRNDARWGGLPILFLANPTDANTIHRAFAIGADDFVSLPIVGAELVIRIIHRLQRIKLQKKLVDFDPLTRVCNYHRATQDLNRLLRLSQRYNQPVCLAVLNLDNFKELNKKFGHTAGNIVLRRLGQLLKQSFRREDVISRWAREEFVIGMYGMNRSYGYQRLIQFLETLNEQKFTTSEGDKFRFTFSAAVAQYPEDGLDIHSLYQSAISVFKQVQLAI